MTIRPTEPGDLKTVMDIYDIARRFMRACGNTTQWVNGYPSEEYITGEIESGHSFVCLDEDSEIVGTFCLILGDDPTYTRIDDGAWLNDAPYGVIHRMASSGKRKGVAAECVKWCFGRCNNIRVDTHRDNQVMRSFLEKQGFYQCGIIYVADGTERIAYQKSITPEVSVGGNAQNMI